MGKYIIWLIIIGYVAVWILAVHWVKENAPPLFNVTASPAVPTDEIIYLNQD